MEIKKINGKIPFKQKYKEMFVINQYLSGIDPDAKAFMEATGIPNDSTVYYSGTAYEITGSAIWAAINNFVKNLKKYGTWTKLIAYYPYVGGSSSTHKWNLKDPRDLDAAFRLSYSGTLTHNYLGVTASNTAYMNTHVSDAEIITDDSHLSCYLKVHNTTNSVDIGVTNAGRSLSIIQANGNLYADSYYISGNDRITVGVASTKGMTTISRVAINDFRAYKAASQIGSSLNNRSYTEPTGNITIFGWTTQYTSIRTSCGNSIGYGLTPSQVADFYTNCVQPFQTEMKRQE